MEWRSDVCSSDLLQCGASPRLVWPPQEFFEAKREELFERHARYGDTADNLEPNLKEGPGGLRDVQTLHWMALRIIGTADMESLVASGQLGADEVATIERDRRALARLRYGQLGRAPVRGRVWPGVGITGVAGSLKKK